MYHVVSQVSIARLTSSAPETATSEPHRSASPLFRQGRLADTAALLRI